MAPISSGRSRPRASSSASNSGLCFRRSSSRASSSKRRQAPGIGLLQLGLPAIGLVEAVTVDPVIDVVGQMPRVPGLEAQEFEHLVLVLFLFPLTQVELGKQELLVSTQPLRGGQLLENRDSLAATASPRSKDRGLERQILRACGIVFRFCSTSRSV